ncbi:hemerythrin family protein [uncultured Selenomonas sp.]|jgi:hemerythrin family protein|uniref:bacteriohemerythrin n=1 Tax=uncultured Selenomonas sp. TaxID=159275 RepID=UPI0028EE3D58|nr:hemerythrin family protein [uncultured Selenomonas sp.]
MKYELTKEYLTGIELIDTEHGKLFDLANECYELVMNDTSDDRFDQIVALLEELRAYAATHFAHEEEYMERIQYERRFSERYQHLRFIQKLSEINLDEIDENQQEYLLGILDFLTRWLFGHIKVMDCRIPKEEDAAAAN